MGNSSTITRRLVVRRALALGTAIVLLAPFVSRTPRASGFPGAGWPEATPESVGLGLTKLLEAQAFAESFGDGAGCVIRHGHVVHRWGSFTQRYQVNSAAKSWGSAVLGLAIDDGRLALGDRA
jgi:hypothetical protein